MGKTLFEKIWDKHLIASIDESTKSINIKIEFYFLFIITIYKK